MKKIIALFLAYMMLFLTACNQTTSSETTSGLPNGSQSQEQPKDSELKDKIIQNNTSDFMDIPSRILFEYPVSSNQFSTIYIFYYSKADGKAYVYCFDPLCDHTGGKCLALPNNFSQNIFLKLRHMFFINNRFYGATMSGKIISFAFDGSDMKVEYDSGYGSGSFTNIWSTNFRVYDKYIYIPMNADENGNPHILRFDTETKEMEDLTEKTGAYILPDFFYNGELYGRGKMPGDWYKADLSMENIEPIEEILFSSQFYGSKFFSIAYDRSGTESKAIGIQSYDMKTGEINVFTNETLGLEESQYTIVATDEKYIYFYPNKTILVGTYMDAKGQERKLYKYNEGKLYRVKHDGTECVCIYDHPEFEFNSSSAVLCGNKIIIDGHHVGIRDNMAVTWNAGMKSGTISPDGTIAKFEDVELIY